MQYYQQFTAERIGKVPVSGLHRFFGIASSMPDVISLRVGEPDFPTPALIAGAESRFLRFSVGWKNGLSGD